MTPKERFFARLAKEPVDKIPNLNILMSFAARYAGRRMDEFCRDYHVLVDANIKSNEKFGIDLLNTMSDAYRETADYGASIVFQHDALPFCEHLLKTPDDMKKLKPFRIEDSARMLDRLHAVELYKQESGGHWPIMGWVEGCAAECSDLMGLSELVYALFDEPDMVWEMMDICLETAKNCIAAQIAAGADVIGIGDAVASVLGPAVYTDWILPYEQKLFSEIRRLGAKGRLHICGNIAPLLADIKTTGADIVDIDWMVDFGQAKAALADSAFICGNFDPVDVVMNGTPERIAKAVRDCILAGDEDCFIMAGCEIPRDTRYENLLAVHEALAK
jgi:MtaA/CmuA family methyltransferase